MYGPRSTLASSPDPGECGPLGDPARRRSRREAPARDRRFGQVPTRFGVLPSANLAKADRALSGAPLLGGIYLRLSSRRGQGAGPRLETAVLILHHRKNGFPAPGRVHGTCAGGIRNPPDGRAFDTRIRRKRKTMLLRGSPFTRVSPPARALVPQGGKCRLSPRHR